MKRILSVILAIGLVLGMTACGKSSAGNAAGSASAAAASMGRWMEEPVQLDETGNVSCFMPPVLMQDGSLCLYGTEDMGEEVNPEHGMCRFTSTDGGKTWKKEALDWEQQVEGKILQVSALADGTCFFPSYVADESGKDVTYSTWMKKAGSDTLTQLELPEGMKLSGGICMLLDAHTLAASVSVSGNTSADSTAESADLTSSDVEEEQKTILFDLDTGAVTDLSGTPADQNLYQAALDTSTGSPHLYFVNYSSSGEQLLSLDASGNTETLFENLPNGVSGCAADADGNFYCLATDGIYRVANGGSLAELVMPSTGFQMGVPSNYCEWLARTPDGDFIASLMSDSQEGSMIYRYHWDETLPSRGEDGLTVWSLDDNATIRAAIAVYQKDHPDVTVDYHAVLGNDSDNSRAADEIQKLNTELLAGGGPDVLILDSTDYQAYARQGLLEDLGGTVDTSGLVQNVISPFVSSEGTYVLPARFCVPIVSGYGETVKDLTSLDALDKAILACPPRPNQDLDDDAYYTELTPEERYGMGFVSVKQLMNFVLESSAPALVQDGKVNEDAVRQALGFVKDVGDYYDMKHYQPDPLYNGVGISGDGSDVVLQEDGGYEFSVTKQAKYGWDCLLSSAYFGEMSRDTSTGSDAIVRPGLVEGAYLPGTLLGVNANSTHKDAALSFVQSVFSEAVQGTFQTDGSPVLQSALDASVQKHKKYNMDAGYKGNEESFFASLKTPVVIDPTVESVMDSHAEALVNGTETLDEAVTGVSNDLSLYLAEKQ